MLFDGLVTFTYEESRSIPPTVRPIIRPNVITSYHREVLESSLSLFIEVLDHFPIVFLYLLQVLDGFAGYHLLLLYIIDLLLLLS